MLNNTKFYFTNTILEADNKIQNTVHHNKPLTSPINYYNRHHTLPYQKTLKDYSYCQNWYNIQPETNCMIQVRAFLEA